MSSPDSTESEREYSNEDPQLPINRRSVLKGTAALGLGTFAGLNTARAESRYNDPVSVDQTTAEQPVEYVDPFIGTARAKAAGGGSGAMPYANIYPGPTTPHGMVQLSPDTSISNIAGYHYEDDSILGFSHTHVSGTGCYGLGNFLATPTTADIESIKGESKSPLNMTDAMSASFWFKTDGEMLGGYTSVLRHDRHITPLQLRDGGNTGTLVWFPADAGSFMTLSFDFDQYTDGSWHHYAITYESGSSATIYVDGEEVASTTDTVGTLKTSQLPWSIGAAVDRGGEYYGGNLDQVIIYDRALSESQVQALAVGEYVAEDSAIVKYAFDEANVERISDLAGGDQPGIVYGDPTWEPRRSEKSLSFDGDDDAVAIELPSLDSSFSHESESAEPGYYAVTLQDYDIEAEVTATDRVGVHRYTFPQSESATIALDAAYNLSDSGTKSASVEIRDNRTIVGSQTVSDPFCSGAEAFDIYFAARFSEPFGTVGTWSESGIDNGRSATGSDVGAYATYSTTDGEEILVKMGISYVSTENALMNLQEETPGWDFDGVRQDTWEMWNERLGRIEVSGDDDNAVKFYTALYNAMKGPTTFNDVNGEYIGMDDEIYTAEDYTHYQMFSLWDTFRAEHPLLNIVEPQVQMDAIKSLIDMHENGGWLPKWQFVNRYTNVMIADHATSAIAESYVKGLRDYDTEKAYEAMYKNSTQIPGGDTDFGGRWALELYTKYGYVPLDYDDWRASQAVSITLEDTYCDYAIAQVADEMGKPDDYEKFIERAGFYENVFDPETKWMRPRYSDGSWDSPFEPTDWQGFTEGNSWSYTWHVLQDIAGLADLMGRQRFIDRLDQYFSKFAYPGWDEPFSHYWQGNEPDQHYPYLYNYVWQPWKTQEVVQDVMNQLYTTGPGGIPGNEDVGQMSAWFVMSAIGFYPVTPASGAYVIGSPAFEKVTIHLSEHYYGEDAAERADKKDETESVEFVVEANGADYSMDRYRYIQNAHLNGDVHRESWFRHEDLTGGGRLRLNMGTEQNKDWGVTPKPHVSPPPSMSDPKKRDDGEDGD
jgi:predicted alpha-1,2-mannosidase